MGDVENEVTIKIPVCPRCEKLATKCKCGYPKVKENPSV